jgi:hypothetical protein
MLCSSLAGFLDAGIERGVEERAENRRVEMMEGIIEGDFRRRHLVSYYSAFSSMEVPYTVMYVFSGSKWNSPVRPAEREIVQSPQREREPIMRPPALSMRPE